MLQLSVRILTAFFLVSAAFAPSFATDEDAPELPEPVVPPGQEQLLSEMLGQGEPLPDGCKFTGGTADGPVIRASYRCAPGEVVFDLVHVSNAADGATQTEHFAIRPESGSLPKALQDVLVSRIRGREADFEWQWLTPEEDEAEDDAVDEDAESPLPDASY